MTMGIDISHHQPNVDWPGMTGVGFVVAKATEGVTFADPMLTSHVTGAKSQGIPAGTYHFARPQSDPIIQARFYARTVLPLAQDLPPILDIEQTGGLSPAQVLAWTRAFLGEASKLLGRACWLYSYGPFVRQNLGTAQLAPYWHAQYGPQMVLPPGWTPKIWQFTDSGHVAGIAGPVDLDRWLGTPTEFSQFTRRLQVPAPQPTPAAVPKKGLDMPIIVRDEKGKLLLSDLATYYKEMTDDDLRVLLADDGHLDQSERSDALYAYAKTLRKEL